MPVKWTQEDLVVFNNGTFGASWFASVLNNENGRNWIKRFREKNPQCLVRTRARSANRIQAFLKAGRTITDYIRSSQKDCPRKSADRFVLYLNPNNWKNKNIMVGKYLDGDVWGFVKVLRIWNEDDAEFLIAESYRGNFTAKWNEKRQRWMKLRS